jgi:hypothetical protein
MHFAVVPGMTVPPQDQLFEQEEGQNSGEQRAERDGWLKRAERLGQQREQGDAEQRPDRVADQPGEQPHADPVAEKEKN